MVLRTYNENLDKISAEERLIGGGVIIGAIAVVALSFAAWHENREIDHPSTTVPSSTTVEIPDNE